MFTEMGHDLGMVCTEEEGRVHFHRARIVC